MTRTTIALLATALVGVLLAGCSMGGDGTTRLTAVFDDVRQLAPRHAVKIQDAQVGSVTSIALDGFRARVTFVVDEAYPVPVGTTAAIEQTSLLGENYVALRLPDDDPATAPQLVDGDEITATTTEVELEDLVREATQVIGAVSSDDVDAILDAAVTGIGGRGQQLNALIGRVADLSTEYAGYKADLQAIIDGLARLGGDVAAGREAIADAIGAATAAADTGARQRERLVASLDAIAELSRTNTEVLLEPHARDLSALLDKLPPVTETLVGQRQRLVDLLHHLDAFNQRFPRATPNGPVQLYAQTRSESGFEQPLIDIFALLREMAPEGGS